MCRVGSSTALHVSTGHTVVTPSGHARPGSVHGRHGRPGLLGDGKLEAGWRASSILMDGRSRSCLLHFGNSSQREKDDILLWLGQLGTELLESRYFRRSCPLGLTSAIVPFSSLGWDTSMKLELFLHTPVSLYLIILETSAAAVSSVAISHLFYFEPPGNECGMQLPPLWGRTVLPGTHCKD